MTCAGSSCPRQVVLVVDDDPAIREALGLILEDSYEVLFADDGLPALELVRTRHPDVVLLDLGLPTMDGFDLLAEMKAITPDLPVVVVTITTRTGAVVRAMKLGAFDYVTKPFEDEEVLAKVRDALTGGSSDSRTTVLQALEADREAASGRQGSSRRRCLVMAGLAGTAGTLRLALERYVATDVVADGIQALRTLDSAIPDCVVCDEEAWAADGAAFVQVLRMQYPGSRAVLITDRPGPDGRARDRATLVDALVPRDAGLGEIVRRTLTLCALDGAAERAEPSLSPHVFAAMEYLRLRYADEPTADDVARAAGVSRGHLAERFRAELGLSLSQYATRLRVEVATCLLRGRSAKLDEVAALAGFRDPSHLSRVFRAHTGQRPGAYRRQFRGE